MNSLQARLLVAASIVFAVFLLLTSFVLENAFQDSALASVDERLQAHLYGLLGVAELEPNGLLTLPKQLSEARFSTLGSGLYAGVLKQDGSPVWNSDSQLGKIIPMPELPVVGAWKFIELTNALDEVFFIQLFSVGWENESNEVFEFTIYVAESDQQYQGQMASFRRSLLGWFSITAFILLLVQWGILNWGLSPLRKVAIEVAAIEEGKQDEIKGHYPREVQLLSSNLNRLLHSSAEHLERYRNALGDLAHSLKTPLAVIRANIENDSEALSEASEVLEQLSSADRAIEYHLQRAAASGRRVMASPIEIYHVVERLINTFKKVYTDKALVYVQNMDADLVFPIDQGDLTEILGNLMDNACKWGQHEVIISANIDNELLTICVEDDGSGINADVRELILERGARTEPAVAGHGIGLAVVRELIESVYQGHLEITESKSGGALIRIQISR